MKMNYEVRYLLNGEEHTAYIETTSAAAASESVRHQEGSEVDDFELIQVQLAEESSESESEEVQAV